MHTHKYTKTLLLMYNNLVVFTYFTALDWQLLKFNILYRGIYRNIFDIYIRIYRYIGISNILSLEIFCTNKRNISLCKLNI